LAAIAACFLALASLAAYLLNSSYKILIAFYLSSSSFFSFFL
jgi:hypothetical protein